MPAPIGVWGVCFQGCAADPLHQKRALHLARPPCAFCSLPLSKAPVKKETLPGKVASDLTT